MNSPYMGKFQVTQCYTPQHDGLDLVGIDSKEIHATISGVVQYAGWEDENQPSKGFGKYVCIQGTDGLYYYYGHMSELRVHTGQTVNICDVIGVEGYTGHCIPDNAYGSHCHYCIRPNFCAGNSENVSVISGIPNEIGTYDDGYRPNENKNENKTYSGEIQIENKKYIINLIENGGN